jgi:Uncharacterized protein conserved in bacteria (DUF2200)
LVSSRQFSSASVIPTTGGILAFFLIAPSTIAGNTKIPPVVGMTKSLLIRNYRLLIKGLQQHIDEKSTFDAFFRQASVHPNVSLITGTICGYRVEDIENPLTQQVRYLDKLVDELAKGWAMGKILRVV